MTHWRQHKCALIARAQDSSYRPWKLFGFWANSGTASGVLPPPKEHEAEFLEPEGPNGESAPEKRLDIRAAGMEHLDEVLQKEQYRKVAQGDKVKLLAEVDGAREGESIKFEIYYSTEEGGSTHFDTVTGTIKDGVGSAEWVADLSKPLRAPNRMT
jgi:hypothetical protein